MAVIIADGDLSKGGAVVETSGGTKCAVFIGEHLEDLRLLVYKNIDGTPALLDSERAVDVHGSEATIKHVHAAIDADDWIHVGVVPEAEETRDVAYASINSATGSWAQPWVQAANYTDGAPTNPGCSLSIDSSGIPHILYVDAIAYHGTDYDQIMHAWDDGGWATELVCPTENNNYSEPYITCCPADDLEAFYRCNSDGDSKYRRKNGSWGTEGAYEQSSAVTEGILCTTGDVVYRYHRWGASSSTCYEIEENNVDVEYNAYGDYRPGEVSAVLVGTDRYIFYIDANRDVHLIKNLGAGWVDEGVQQEGTFRLLIAEWAYNNEHQSGEINYIFEDETDVFFDAFSLGPPPAGQPMIIRTRGIPTGPGSRIGGAGWN